MAVLLGDKVDIRKIELHDGLDERLATRIIVAFVTRPTVHGDGMHTGGGNDSYER